MPGLLLDNMTREIEHVLGDLDVLDVVEIIRRIPNFVRVSQQHDHQAVLAGFKRDDVFAAGENDAGQRHLVERADGFAHHRVGIMADLAIEHDVIRPHQVEVVDFLPRHKLVDLNRAGRFQRDVFELVLLTSRYLSVSTL